MKKTPARPIPAPLSPAEAPSREFLTSECDDAVIQAAVERLRPFRYDRSRENVERYLRIKLRALGGMRPVFVRPDGAKTLRAERKSAYREIALTGHDFVQALRALDECARHDLVSVVQIADTGSGLDIDATLVRIVNKAIAGAEARLRSGDAPKDWLQFLILNLEDIYCSLSAKRITYLPDKEANEHNHKDVEVPNRYFGKFVEITVGFLHPDIRRAELVTELKKRHNARRAKAKPSSEASAPAASNGK